MKKLLPFSFLFLFSFVYSQISFQKSYGTKQITLPPLPNGFNSTKLIIIAFDDSSRTEFTLAKPILDKYGFKGSFFTVFTFVNAGSAGKDKSRMNSLRGEGSQGEEV